MNHVTYCPLTKYKGLGTLSVCDWKARVRPTGSVYGWPDREKNRRRAMAQAAAVANQDEIPNSSSFTFITRADSAVAFFASSPLTFYNIRIKALKKWLSFIFALYHALRVMSLHTLSCFSSYSTQKQFTVPKTDNVRPAILPAQKC